MDHAILDRFALPGPLRHHAAIVRGSDDERTARINAVMPKIVARTNAFRDSLRPRERHSFAVEDVLQEIWLELLTKDHYYQPERSKYITFALCIVNKKLGEIRNRWHTVPGPKNTAALLRDGEGHQDATTERIRQTVRETTSLVGEPDDLLDRDRTAGEAAAREETREQAIRALTEGLSALGLLDRRARLILQSLYGIGRQRPLDVSQVAEAFSLACAEVVAIQRRAEEELARLTMLPHDVGDILDLDVA